MLKIRKERVHKEYIKLQNWVTRQNKFITWGVLGEGGTNKIFLYLQ